MRQVVRIYESAGYLRSTLIALVMSLVTSLGAVIVLPTALGCAATVPRSKTEDQARQTVPVPICLKPLPRRGAPGAIISLGRAEYWSLLLPGFNPARATVDPLALDCSGRKRGTELLGDATGPVAVTVDDAVVAPGPDGFKIVWLPIRNAAGTSGHGLLALVRQRETHLDVYAMGVHQGLVSGTRFVLERMGRSLVISAIEERCEEGTKKRCQSSGTVFLMALGKLAPAATFPVDRIADGKASGAHGQAEYRFSASATYLPDSIRLTEHLSVRDAAHGEVSSSDLERVFRLEGAALVASGESLWVRTAREHGFESGETPTSPPP